MIGECTFADFEANVIPICMLSAPKDFSKRCNSWNLIYGPIVFTGGGGNDMLTIRIKGVEDWLLVLYY